ncbi:MAG: hypothetical protein JXB39_09320 [Deltaproteobacteria bacterium]|nr:hypothetical protein [Deltaproteobacteria bacterium]
MPSRLDPFADRVGVLSDGKVAELAGVTRAAVQMYRRRHGIPPSPAYPGPHRKRAEEPKAVQIVETDTPVEEPVTPAPAPPKAAPPKGKIGRPSKIGQYIDQVGVMPDAELAELAGVAESTVRSWRRIKARAERASKRIRRSERRPPTRKRTRRAPAPVEAAPVEAVPVEAAPVEAAPVEAAPVEAVPVEAAPVEAAPRGRILSDRTEAMLQELAHIRGIDPDAALAVAVAEDYLRCRRVLG